MTNGNMKVGLALPCLVTDGVTVLWNLACGSKFCSLQCKDAPFCMQICHSILVAAIYIICIPLSEVFQIHKSQVQVMDCR